VATGDYITTAELKDTLEIASTFADPDIQRAITSASRAIDQTLNRSFATGPAGEQRFYTAILDGQLVLTDDLVSVSALATDDTGDRTYSTAWQPADYELGPPNAAATGAPFTNIRPSTKGNHPDAFPTTYDSVRVTGVFGWPTAPEQVKEATTIIATRLLLRSRQAPFGVVTAGVDGAAVRISRFDPDVALLLDPLNNSQLIA
jgi:hypothetical protein